MMRYMGTTKSEGREKDGPQGLDLIGKQIMSDVF
jgi:hypothetical protein